MFVHLEIYTGIHFITPIVPINKLLAYPLSRNIFFSVRVLQQIPNYSQMGHD